MASNADFVQYIVDQCSGAGEIAARKMMGDYCVYCDGILFGLICDNNFYVKVTDAGRAVVKEIDLRPPYSGAKDCFYIGDVDDRDYLADLVRVTVPELLSKGRPANTAPRNKQVPTSLDDVIVPDVTCSQELRAFFVKHIGKEFRYKVGFQKWLHENAGMTYRDAVEIYPEL